MKMFDLKKVTVTSNLEISAGVCLVSWKREFSFLPGQVVRVAVNRAEVPRIYSLCGGAGAEEASILFNIKEGGFLTPRLAAVRPGDQIFVSSPYGTFTDVGSPAWWIASGTGIAPFYSFVMSGISENRTLIHGVRSMDQFYFSGVFEQKMAGRYVRCCSGGPGEGVYHGRVTAWLSEVKEIPPSFKYYLCGKALMVVEVRDLLIGRGVPYGNIYAEIYF